MDTRPPERADGMTGGPAPDDDPPPILGRWSALYAAVVAELLLVVAFCYWLSRRGR